VFFVSGFDLRDFHGFLEVDVFVSVYGDPRIRGYIWKGAMMKAFPQVGN
jgi:hypothetical protein